MTFCEFFVAGIRDYCQKYGENITRVCAEQGGPLPLSGDTLDKAEEALCKAVPLDQLNERRAWRDSRLAAVVVSRREHESESKGAK